jgi:hypothetical protein
LHGHKLLLLLVGQLQWHSSCSCCCRSRAIGHVAWHAAHLLLLLLLVGQQWQCCSSCCCRSRAIGRMALQQVAAALRGLLLLSLQRLLPLPLLLTPLLLLLLALQRLLPLQLLLQVLLLQLLKRDRLLASRQERE